METSVSRADTIDVLLKQHKTCLANMALFMGLASSSYTPASTSKVPEYFSNAGL